MGDHSHPGGDRRGWCQADHNELDVVSDLRALGAETQSGSSAPRPWAGQRLLFGFGFFPPRRSVRLSTSVIFHLKGGFAL